MLGYFSGIKPGGIGEEALYYENEGAYKPLRFCAMRETKEAEQAGLEVLRKTQMRKHKNKELIKAQRAYKRYVIVVTSITDVAAELILELYQQRWHIELV